MTLERIKISLDIGQKDFSREQVAYLLSIAEAAEDMAKVIEADCCGDPECPCNERSPVLANYRAKVEGK